MRNTTLSMVLLAVLAGCGGHEKSEPTVAPSPLARVAVMRDGRVFLDGKAVAVGDFQKELTAAQRAGAKGVLYYREDGESEPHANALVVMQAIAELGAPVRLSSKPDYSDSIGPDGQSR